MPENTGVKVSSLDASAPAATERASGDQGLVDRLLAGDEAAFEGLVGAYHGSLLRLARTFVPDHGVAEEVVQETWLAVLNGLTAFEGRSSLKTWIFRILTNRARTRGWRERRTIPFSSLAGASDDDETPAVDPDRFTQAGAWATPPSAWLETPETSLLRVEARQVIEDAIAALPAAQRAVITLRDVEGLDAAEVCRLLDISNGNQRVLLHRARARVRAALDRHWHDGTTLQQRGTA
jgi:RNA polymerase sigma-70 factor, ECF subfamily